MFVIFRRADRDQLVNIDKMDSVTFYKTDKENMYSVACMSNGQNVFQGSIHQNDYNRLLLKMGTDFPVPIVVQL